MLWLFDMHEDGEKCSDWPAINYRLSMFGKDDWRQVKHLPLHYRSHGGARPEYPGVRWIPKPYCPSNGEPQPYVPLMMQASPNEIEYSLCDKSWHVRIQESLQGGSRMPQVLNVEPCHSDHREDVEKVAVQLNDLPRVVVNAYIHCLRRRSFKHRLVEMLLRLVS